MAKKSPKNKGGRSKKPNNSGKLGSKGRKTNGQFKKGNQHSVGNLGPGGSKVQKLRDAMLVAVSADDIKKIIQKLVKQAKKGDAKAAKEVLDRCLGKPIQPVQVGGEGGGPVEIVHYWRGKGQVKGKVKVSEDTR